MRCVDLEWEMGDLTLDFLERMSLPQVLTSGALGAGLGGALAGAGKVGSELYKATPALVENMLAKIGRVIGLDASRSKQLLARELSSEVGVSPELLAAKGTNKPKLQDVSTAEIYGETQIKVAGRVVATTPKASSLTLVDVASWFRGESNKVAGMIDKSLSIEAQIIQAQKLQQELMEGAVAALYDPALGATLREAFARPSIEKLMAEVGGAGEKQLKAVLDKLTAPDKTRKWFEPGACFAAGTLVHTKEGLVPIEQIKVGDYVLSKPENGGEQAYKRVLKTFEYPEETVIQILYALMEDLGKASRPAYPLTVTPNHPFWLSRSGWTAAREISANSADHGDNYELIDGTNVIPDGIQKLFISDLPGVGWMGNAVGSSIGALWDFVNHKLIANDVPVREDILDDEVEDPFLRLTVYNLEVEDFHTYYVGKHGVWVHNQNCNGLTFDVQGNAPKLTAKQTERPFLSRKEATDYFKGKTLQQLNLKDEVYLMPATKPSQVDGIPQDAWARWVKHEEQVPGRIKDNNGIRMEYVLPFEDPRSLSGSGLPSCKFHRSDLVFSHGPTLAH